MHLFRNDNLCTTIFIPIFIAKYSNSIPLFNQYNIDNKKVKS